MQLKTHPLDLKQTPDFLNPHSRICLLILEGSGGGRETERQRERVIDVRERNMDQLPPIGPLMGDGTAAFDVREDSPTNLAT